MSSKPATPWVSLKLGRALNYVDINVPSCPAITEPAHMKAQAFSATVQAISAHLVNFDYAELSACLTSHVPGQHVFLLDQANAIDPKLNNAPFLTTNIIPIGFFLADKTPIDISAALDDITLRPAQMQYFRVQFTVDPSVFAPTGTSLSQIAPFTGEYDIPLPQSPVRSTTPMPRLNLWPQTNTPPPRRPVPRRFGHTIHRFAHNALRTVFGSRGNRNDPTPEPPLPVETPGPNVNEGPSNRRATGPVPPRPAHLGPVFYTFTGDLAFLENQALFDSMCPVSPALSLDVQHKWADFRKHLKWTALVQLLRLSYVGTLTDDDKVSFVDDCSS